MSDICLNLGCGRDILKSGETRQWINVDAVALDGVDTVHHLDTGPWPWQDGTISGILAQDVFEHVQNPVLFMNEAWRILKPGGRLSIKSPHWRDRDAYTDPTHRRFCTEHTWDYWTRGTFLYERHGAAYRDPLAMGFVQTEMDIMSGAIYIQLVKDDTDHRVG